MALQRNRDKSFPWLSALLYGVILLVAPFISEYLFAAAFAIQMYRMIRYDLSTNCMDMAFLISFSALYRLPGGISYIAIYVFLFDIIFLLKTQKIYIGTGFVLFLVAIAYAAMRSGGQWNAWFFVFCGLLLLYLLYFSCKQTGSRGVLWAFIIGAVISSAYALAFGDFPAIRAIIMRDVEINDQRFRGLFADPNYYATFLILAISSLICLNQSKRIPRIIYYSLIAFLIFAGAQTVSKSFVLMLLGVFVYYCISLFVQKRFLLGFALLTGVALMVFLVIDGKIELFRAVIQRFKEAEDMSGLSTGRTDIWVDYIRVICSDPFVLLFGAGLSAPMVGVHGTHNIFLETVYNFGVVGLIFFFAFFATVLKKISIQLRIEARLLPVRFLPIGAVMVMYLFLQGISSLLFYLSLFIMYQCYGCSVLKKN